MVDGCECGNEPSGSVNAGNFFPSCKPVSCSRRTVHHGVSKYNTTFRDSFFDTNLELDKNENYSRLLRANS